MCLLFFQRYYYVIAIELVSGTSPQDPSTYQPQDLKKYDPVTTKPGTPYIAAVISSSDFSKSKQFVLGDGKTTSTSSSRRKRQARAVKDEYVNSALKPDKVYSVFIRAVSASVSDLFVCISFCCLHHYHHCPNTYHEN